VKGVLDGTFEGKTQKQKLMDFRRLSKPGAACEKPQISPAQTFCVFTHLSRTWR
jgi:hypothetical protein